MFRIDLDPARRRASACPHRVRRSAAQKSHTQHPWFSSAYCCQASCEVGCSSASRHRCSLTSSAFATVERPRLQHCCSPLIAGTQQTCFATERLRYREKSLRLFKAALSVAELPDAGHTWLQHDPLHYTYPSGSQEASCASGVPSLPRRRAGSLRACGCADLVESIKVCCSADSGWHCHARMLTWDARGRLACLLALCTNDA